MAPKKEQPTRKQPDRKAKKAPSLAARSPGRKPKKNQSSAKPTGIQKKNRAEKVPPPPLSPIKRVNRSTGLVLLRRECKKRDIKTGRGDTKKGLAQQIRDYDGPRATTPRAASKLKVTLPPARKPVQRLPPAYDVSTLKPYYKPGTGPSSKPKLPNPAGIQVAAPATTTTNQATNPATKPDSGRKRKSDEVDAGDNAASSSAPVSYAKMSMKELREQCKTKGITSARSKVDTMQWLKDCNSKNRTSPPSGKKPKNDTSVAPSAPEPSTSGNGVGVAKPPSTNTFKPNDDKVGNGANAPAPDKPASPMNPTSQPPASPASVGDRASPASVRNRPSPGQKPSPHSPKSDSPSSSLRHSTGVTSGPASPSNTLGQSPTNPGPTGLKQNHGKLQTQGSGKSDASSSNAKPFDASGSGSPSATTSSGKNNRPQTLKIKTTTKHKKDSSEEQTRLATEFECTLSEQPRLGGMLGVDHGVTFAQFSPGLDHNGRFGNCLYQALAWALFGTEIDWDQTVREPTRNWWNNVMDDRNSQRRNMYSALNVQAAETPTYMGSPGRFDAHGTLVYQMRSYELWGTSETLQVLADAFDVEIIVHVARVFPDGGPTQWEVGSRGTFTRRQVHLVNYPNQQHWTALRPDDRELPYNYHILQAVRTRAPVPCMDTTGRYTPDKEASPLRPGQNGGFDAPGATVSNSPIATVSNLPIATFSNNLPTTGSNVPFATGSNDPLPPDDEGFEGPTSDDPSHNSLFRADNESSGAGDAQVEEEESSSLHSYVYYEGNDTSSIS